LNLADIFFSLVWWQQLRRVGAGTETKCCGEQKRKSKKVESNLEKKVERK
jgi:hypothetical protein